MSPPSNPFDKYITKEKNDRSNPLLSTKAKILNKILKTKSRK